MCVCTRTCMKVCVLGAFLGRAGNGVIPNPNQALKLLQWGVGNLSVSLHRNKGEVRRGERWLWLCDYHICRLFLFWGSTFTFDTGGEGKNPIKKAVKILKMLGGPGSFLVLVTYLGNSVWNSGPDGQPDMLRLGICHVAVCGCVHMCALTGVCIYIYRDLCHWFLIGLYLLKCCIVALCCDSYVFFFILLKCVIKRRIVFLSPYLYFQWKPLVCF